MKDISDRSSEKNETHFMQRHSERAELLRSAYIAVMNTPVDECFVVFCRDAA